MRGSVERAAAVCKAAHSITEVTCLDCDCLETETLNCRVDLQLLLPGGQAQAQVGLSDA